MGEIDERRQILSTVFKNYDIEDSGELTKEQLQRLHGEMRMGGVSLSQVEASIRYSCIDNTCELTELYDVLQELDRRYFLIQDLRWEFSMLDRDQSNTITEEQAKWLVQAVHGKYFSAKKWEKFILMRLIPRSGVTFGEIEVMLCDIPSRYDHQAEQLEADEEREAKLRRQQQIERQVLEEKENSRKEKERERQHKEQEEREKQRRQLEEEDRLRREEAERVRRQQLEEEEKESKRLLELEEEHRREDARRRSEEERMYKNVEQLAEEEARLEKKADEDLKDAQQRKRKAQDARSKKEAETDESDAAARKTNHKQKRIRYDLKVAIKTRDSSKLQTSVKEFQDEKLEDEDSDLMRAQRLLREMTSGDYLRRAMSEMEISQLEDAMDTVKKHGVEAQLAKEMIAANKMLARLRRLERIRHEILELKQATVAEIRSYQNPPAIVHTVMTCTFLLLGHPEKETKIWKSVQALVGKTGKESLKRGCLGCDPGTLNPVATARAKSLLDKHDLDEVRDVSAGAATFFVWSITMIEESIEIAHQKEEERLNPKPKSEPSPPVTMTTPKQPGGNQRNSRSKSTGRNQRSTSKTPERNSIQEKMNKVAAARHESEDQKRRRSVSEQQS